MPAIPRKNIKSGAPSHSELIDSLGGTTRVRQLIEDQTGKKITPHAVTMMKKRDCVSERYRYLLANEARRLKKPLPDNFLLGA